MLRLTGILTGSALTIAVMVFMIGVPQFTQPAGDTPVTPRNDELVPAEPVVAANLPRTELDVDEFVPDPQPEPTPEPYVQNDETPLPDAVVSDAVAGLERLSEVQQAPAPEFGWYAFWSPSRSEIAAHGFVSELQRTTGLDYRVVKLKPGVYEVAFAYANDVDREQKLSQIAAATGLDVSGG